MIANGYLTMDRKHPDFEKVIWGRFSNDKVALLEGSINASGATENLERLTFVVKDRPRTGLIKSGIAALKIKNLHWVLFPMLLVLVKNIIDETLQDEILALLSVLGAVALQLGVEMANDVQDYVNGVDRIHPQSANRALKAGWLRPYEMQKFSYVLIALGCFLGLPSVIFFPEILLLVGPFLLLSLVGLKRGAKYQIWSEIFVFLFFGPLLTLGFQMSFGGGFDLEAVFLGVLTGWLVWFQVHLKNFRFLMVNSQASFNNSMTRLGFEGAKRALVYWWILFLVLSGFYLSVYATDTLQFYGLFTVEMILTILIFGWTRKLMSPIGSQMQEFIKRANLSVMIVMGCWIAVWLFNYLQFQTLA